MCCHLGISVVKLEGRTDPAVQGISSVFGARVLRACLDQSAVCAAARGRRQVGALAWPQHHGLTLPACPTHSSLAPQTTDCFCQPSGGYTTDHVPSVPAVAGLSLALCTEAGPGRGGARWSVHIALAAQRIGCRREGARPQQRCSGARRPPPSPPALYGGAPLTR